MLPATQIGIREAGTHRIHRHAAWTPIPVPMIAPIRPPHASQHVGADIGITLEARGRCDRNDATVATLPHRGQYGLDGMDHAHEVDIHHALKQRSVGFREGRGFSCAGIGDQDIDRLPRRRLGDGGTHARLIGNIRDPGKMRSPRADCLIQHGLVAAEHGNRGTGLRQFGGDGAADASPAPVISACAERGNPDMRWFSRMMVLRYRSSRIF